MRARGLRWTPPRRAGLCHRRPTEAGLRAELAHAVFGKAACAALEDWRGAADGFEAYFAIAAMEQSRSRPGAEFREPLLGGLRAAARWHRAVQPARARRRRCSSAFTSRRWPAFGTKVCYTDEWGNELYGPKNYGGGSSGR